MSSIDLTVALNISLSEKEELFQRPIVPIYESDERDEQGKPCLQVYKAQETGYFQLSYTDGSQFFINPDGTQVWTTCPDHLSIEDTATYLLGPVLGFVLRLRGITCLHASAIAVGQEAIAFVGDSGAGKSTTAAAFAKLGYPILSDDIVALVPQDNHFFIQPAYPRIRLWSSSVKILFESPDALPRLVPTNPTWDKRYLHLNGREYHFQNQPLPLTQIYFLSPRDPQIESPYLQKISPASSLIKLIKHTYANVLLDSKMRANEFSLLSQLVRAVSCSEIVPSSNPKQIQKLCEVILNNFSKAR
ncbi:hypothetical protein PJF56_18710 [Roseofilum sp. BLCC_M91]|uniref:Serine/threonine protein kinase n=1 Tax=Roseofilum halophilum BLCC-M91 TaxID=3022259 RepID=A0ABT7BP09_9CYAN|nr:hypothetical protein [Roseofilum halophilum]MDJ1180896.1 hypothetical protein [Roseofilum halophilum BLCC-M91]